MTSIISNFDFENVEFGTAPGAQFYQVIKTPEEQSSILPQTKTSYSIFESYIQQLTSKTIIDVKLKEAVEKYFNGDIAKCLKNVTDKLQIIKSVESSKSAFLVFADTTKNKNSFYYPNTALYNYTILNDTPAARNFIVSTIRQYNFTEHNYTNYSRLFFDIDLKGLEQDKLDDLVKLFKLIKYCCDRYSLAAYGTIEYKTEFVNEFLPHQTDYQFSTQNGNQILWFQNNNPNAKTLSGHIYLDGYSNRETIMNYMKYLKDKFQIQSNVFDVSVYKTTKQAFRMSYSAKINPDASPRLPCDDLVNYIIQYPEIIDNLRMAPRPSDKQIEIEPFELSRNEKIKQTYFKQKENVDSSSLTTNSIFKYMKTNNTIVDLKQHVFDSAINHFEFAGLFCPYLSMPLTIEEFQNEFHNIQLIENEEYTKEINQDYLSNALQTLNYTQDYKNIQPLYALKKYTYQHLENYKDECKQQKIIPDETIIDEHKEVLESIDYFISKYSKISFASHHDSFYNILQTRQGTKEQKILYNIYGLIDGRYIEPLTSTTFKNITELRNYYRFSSETAKYLQDCITYYKSQSEYEFYIAQYEYSRLNEESIKKINSDVNELIKILQSSFYDENDMKYYLGFLSAKLKNKKSLNKGIINQPRCDGGSGKDSLKTFITDLLDSYLNIMSPNVENINKPLNGSYFKSDLIVFQEIPRNVKDIENFINRLKENSCVKKLTIEEKGLNAVKQINTTDFIINTNHTMEKLFYNKNDCEALLKRFKVLERKTINMKDPHINEILDQFGHLHNTEINELLHSHAFYLHLMNNDDYYNYYLSQRDTENDVEKLYMASAVETNDTDTIITNYNQEQFIDDFKKRFFDCNKKIKIKQVLTELMTNVKEYKEIKKPDTIKHKLLTTRMVTYNESNRKYSMTDDQIKMFYEKYYTYEMPETGSNLNNFTPNM